MSGVGPTRGVGLDEARRTAAVTLIERHDRALRRTARRFSICADDAEDAYQRAMEILLTKAPPLEPEAMIRWMQVVTRREAHAVRRQRERLLGTPPPTRDDGPRPDPVDSLPAPSPTPDERALRLERVRRSGEALHCLKPQEVRALTLKAEGFSYAEIQEITGWTYTKVNRCMAEGRKRFLELYSEIEAGGRCERFAPSLSAIADGEDDPLDPSETMLHLRSCAGCRARLRAYRRVPKRVLAGAPVGLLVIGAESLSETAAQVMDRARGAAFGVGRAFEAVGERVSALAGGGVQGAGATGFAKALAVCGATVAGGATCVAAGGLPVALPEPLDGQGSNGNLERAVSESTGQSGVTFGSRRSGTSGRGTDPSSQANAGAGQAGSSSEFEFESSDGGTPQQIPSARAATSPGPPASPARQSTASDQFGFEQ